MFVSLSHTHTRPTTHFSSPPKTTINFVFKSFSPTLFRMDKLCRWVFHLLIAIRSHRRRLRHIFCHSTSLLHHPFLSGHTMFKTVEMIPTISHKQLVHVSPCPSTNEQLSTKDKLRNCHVPNAETPKEHVAMHVGVEGDRFFIPIKYLGHANFKMLLEEAAQEFGFDHEGLIHLPCSVSRFLEIIDFQDDDNINQLQDDDEINDIDFQCPSRLHRLLLIIRSLSLNRIRNLTNKSCGYSSLPSNY